MKAAAGEGGTEKRGLGRKGGKATRPLYKCPGPSLRRRQDDMPRTGATYWVGGGEQKKGKRDRLHASPSQEIRLIMIPPKKKSYEIRWITIIMISMLTFR